MYTLLYGALKNMGDFLIYERSKSLLDAHKGHDGFLEFNGLTAALDEHLDEINKTKAVIICGGPGIVHSMYPRKYPLARDLGDIRVPIFVLGGGWFGVPGDDATAAEYSFDQTTHGFFERMRREGHDIAVRDALTERVLRDSGVQNVAMTGCPSWYDAEGLDRPFEPLAEVQTAAFTPPANRMFNEQALATMRVLRSLLPNARLVCSFHRGLEADRYTPGAEADASKWLASEAEALGFEVADAAYGLEVESLYRECDLHVGYRLHGHIQFLAKRKPSLLIEEDGRGRGFSETVGLPGIRAWRRTTLGRAAAALKDPRVSHILARRHWDVRPDPDVPQAVRHFLSGELANGFAAYRELSGVFQQHHETMTRFLASIP